MISQSVKSAGIVVVGRLTSHIIYSSFYGRIG